MAVVARRHRLLHLRPGRGHAARRRRPGAARAGGRGGHARRAGAQRPRPRRARRARPSASSSAADGRVLSSTPSGLPALVVAAGAAAGARRADGAAQRRRSRTLCRQLADPRRPGRACTARRHAVVVAQSLAAARRDARPAAPRVPDRRPGRARRSRSSPATASPPPRCGRWRRCGGARRRSRGSTAGSRLPIPRSRDEVSRLAETLNDMLARLEAALEHERRFVDDASHELRTPLALLRTELELALRHPRSRDGARAGAALGGRGRRAAEPARRGPAARSPASTRGACRSAASRSRRAALLEDVAAPLRVAGAARRGARSRVEAPDGLRLDADPCGSGRRSATWSRTRSSTAAARSCSRRSAANGRVELHVTDEGPGVAARLPPRAFDRFSRADEARGRGGTGLGLAIVDVIARAHGGEAGLANRAGGGRGRLDRGRPRSSSAHRAPSSASHPRPGSLGRDARRAPGTRPGSRRPRRGPRPRAPRDRRRARRVASPSPARSPATSPNAAPGRQEDAADRRTPTDDAGRPRRLRRRSQQVPVPARRPPPPLIASVRAGVPPPRAGPAQAPVQAPVQTPAPPVVVSGGS